VPDTLSISASAPNHCRSLDHKHLRKETPGTMRPHHVLVSLVVAGGHAAAESIGPALNITALSTRDGYSVLECWQLSSVPVDYMSAVNYAVGNTTVATWSRIPPRTMIGEAWAPHVQ